MSHPFLRVFPPLLWLSCVPPLKFCMGIAFLSRADREIAVFRHVAPPSRLRLEFPHDAARQASLSITNSRSSLSLTSIESVFIFSEIQPN